MFLKKIEDINKTQLFQKYFDLNAEINIEFIISLNELDKFKRTFLKGNYFYTNNLFNEIKRSTIYNKYGELKSKIFEEQYFKNYKNTITLNINPKNEETKDLSNFKILNNSDFKILRKDNEKSKKYFVECFSDIKLFNEIFGNFELKRDKIYSMDIDTVGRNPILKNNNYFISKRRIYELIKEGKIKTIKEHLTDIVRNI